MEKAAKKAEKDKIADERKQMYVPCPCALASVTKLMNQCPGVIFVRFITFLADLVLIGLVCSCPTIRI